MDGSPRTDESRERVAAAEQALQSLGLSAVRVHDHGLVARLAVAPEQVIALMDDARRQAAVEAVKAVGFSFVALDLEGLNPPV